MSNRRLAFIILSCAMVLLLTSCGPGQILGPEFTPTPTSTLTPTPTSTPTPVPPTPTPAFVPGIDEPILVEFREIQLLDSYTKESRVRDSETDFPSNPGDIFFVLRFDFSSFGDRDWIGRNGILSCGDYQYLADSFGFYIGDDSRLQYWFLTYEVAQDLDFEICKFLIKGSEIELATFFK